MKNAKHTIVALAAVAMISTMAVKQAYDFKASNRLAALLSNSASEPVLSQNVITIDPAEAEAQLYETYTEEEIESIVEKKSELSDSYVLLSYGTLNVYDMPSEEGTVTDTLEASEPVKITESTDGWYKVAYGQGLSGYVSQDKITDSKAEADYMAMHYDNYKRGKVKTSGDNVNVRSSASQSAEIVGQLPNGADLVLVYDDNGYTKVYYGADYEAGFVVSTSIELTNTWIPKTEVAAVQTAAAERKAAEAKAAAEAAAKKKAEEEAKKKAEAAAKAAKSSSKSSSSSSKSGSYTTPPSSSKGQSIVNTAKRYLGVRYVWGGTSPKGFDCSGLVQYVCKQNGISVSRTSAAQFGNGKAVNKSDLQPGDLVFFAKNGRVHHVGIYIGNGQMIHAPQTGDVVKIASMETSYYRNSYVGARRVY